MGISFGDSPARRQRPPETHTGRVAFSVRLRNGSKAFYEIQSKVSRRPSMVFFTNLFHSHSYRQAHLGDRLQGDTLQRIVTQYYIHITPITPCVYLYCTQCHTSGLGTSSISAQLHPTAPSTLRSTGIVTLKTGVDLLGLFLQSCLVAKWDGQMLRVML